MAANPLAFIEARLDSFNPTDQRIAAWIQDNQEDASRLSIDQVAEVLEVSKSTLVRFSQKLGFSGWAAFKREMANIVSSHAADEGEDGLPKRAVNRICQAYATYLQQMPDLIDDGELDALAEQILSAKRLFVAGYDRSFFPAEQLHKRLLVIGVSSQPTSSLGSFEPIFETFDADDLILFFTVRDNTRSFGKLMDELAPTEVKLACITCTPALPFKNKCTHYVTLPQASRNPLVPFLDDEALFFVFIEVLIDAIAKRKAAQEG